MSEPTITLQMPQPLYQRLQRLAELTHRPLESLIFQSLDAHLPPLLEDMPESMREDLHTLEKLDDEALRHVAQGVWSTTQHERYTELLEQDRASALTPSEQVTLEELYQDANRHMLRKAYAHALLKWSGHELPPLAARQSAP